MHSVKAGSASQYDSVTMAIVTMTQEEPQQSPRADGEDRRSGMPLALSPHPGPRSAASNGRPQHAPQPPVAKVPVVGPRVTCPKRPPCSCSCTACACAWEGEIGRQRDGRAAGFGGAVMVQRRFGLTALLSPAASLRARPVDVSPACWPRGRSGEVGNAQTSGVLVLHGEAVNGETQQ